LQRHESGWNCFIGKNLPHDYSYFIVGKNLPHDYSKFTRLQKRRLIPDVAYRKTTATEGDAMSNTDTEKTRVIAFRSRPDLTNATEAAAAIDLCSLSDVARGALARDLRRRGLLVDTAKTAEAEATVAA
jgi:hypothetical protein